MDVEIDMLVALNALQISYFLFIYFRIMKHIMSRCCGHILRNDLPTVTVPVLSKNIAPVPAPCINESIAQRKIRARLSRAAPMVALPTVAHSM